MWAARGRRVGGTFGNVWKCTWMRLMSCLSMNLSLHLWVDQFWNLSRYSVLSFSKHLFESLSNNIFSL